MNVNRLGVGTSCFQLGLNKTQTREACIIFQLVEKYILGMETVYINLVEKYILGMETVYINLVEKYILGMEAVYISNCNC